MFNIQQFFTRFKNRELDEINFFTTIIDSIKIVLQLEIEPKLISYSNNTIFLKIPPAAKSAILLKKKEILEKIKKKTNKKVFDIK